MNDLHALSGFFGTQIPQGSLYLPSTVRLSAEGYAGRDFTLSLDTGTPRNPSSPLLDFRPTMQFTAGSGDTRVSRLPARRDEFVFDRFRVSSAGSVVVRTWWGDEDPHESRELRLELWCEGSLLHTETQVRGSTGRGFTAAAARAGDCEVRLYPWRRTENRLYRIDLRYPR